MVVISQYSDFILKKMKKNYEEYFKPEEQVLIRNHNLDWAVIELAKDCNKILDVGAGAGVLANKLIQLGKEITCIDIKKDNVEYMKKNGLNAIEGDINNLPFKDKEFDLAIAEEVLEHIENLGNGLKELCRVAKNIIFTLPKNYEDEWHLWNIDYIPYLSNANCIAIRLSKKEEK